MDRAAAFVDAGYLFAQGSILIAGKKLRRGETRLDEPKVLAFLEGLVKAATGLPLLRIYWYDGTNSGPSPVHISLAYRPNVKVRLGIVNAFGEQKGVDSLIVTDLINLSRNGAMTDAVLVTGDEDIRVGVQQAQEFGVRVHLVGLEHAQSNQSNLLRQESDTLREISKAEVQTFLTQVPPAVPVAPLPTVASAFTAPAVAGVPGAPAPVLHPAPGVVPLVGSVLPLQAAAELLASTLPKTEVDRVVQDATGGVPPDIDRQLLRAGSAAVKGASLTEQEKRDMRKAFIKACKSRP